VVDIFSKLPYELPALLFHDAEAGGRLLTAAAATWRIRVPEAVPGDECATARHGGKLLFPIPDRGLAQRLHRITAKTLIVWGREDALIHTVYGDAFKRGDFEIEIG
jgi:pimeloyl-ACP methyl ester carboxylesterase